jgi:uncharacterized RDD family membrane protein YckC
MAPAGGRSAAAGGVASHGDRRARRAKTKEQAVAGPANYPGYPAYQPMGGMTMPNYASWGLRFVAYIVDGLIAGIIASIVYFVFFFIGFALSGAMSAASTASSNPNTAPATASVNGGLLGLFIFIGVVLVIAFALWYFPRSWAKTGQTIGQRMFHIKVIREDGQLLSFGMGVLRYIVGMGILDGIVFGLPIGWLWPLWDSKKQAWHDKIAGSIVVMA